MKYEPTCRYRKSGDGYESRIFQTIAEIPEKDGWCEHWLDIESDRNNSMISIDKDGDHEKSVRPDRESDRDVIAANEYDKEVLEMIFNQEGIKGLRIIGKHFGVKSKSKEALIKLIMERQNDSE